ncbi:hypothetical protein K438DRAFT_1967744 [Mycena galopus ATCC 62051]|nr:hypothetical protein K438DRAFT_1967744 [Mycena galopus ATCC 62051]
MMKIPDKTLEIYGSENIPVVECVHVLRNATNLSSATFGLVPRISQDLVTSLSPLINLRNLEDAEDGTAPLLAMDLLRHLILPSLSHLTLQFTHAEDRPSADISGFLFLASRSFRQLHKLTLCFLPTSETGLLPCLQRAPSITTLQVQLRTRADGVFHRLTLDRDFLPHLESLEIFHDVEPPVDLSPTADGVLDMPSSRRYTSDAINGPFQFDYEASDATNLLTASVISDSRYGLLEDSGMDVSAGQTRRDYSWCVEF